jgi:hypothetical protein
LKKQVRCIQENRNSCIHGLTLRFVLIDLCDPESDGASACHIARADFHVSGEDQDSAGSHLRSSLESIFENVSFKDDLLMNRVVDVRLQELVVVPAIIAPSSRSGENHDTARSTVVAVLSVAAGIVVAAIALRKFMPWSSAVDKYNTSNPDNDSFGDQKLLEESFEQQY